MRCGKARKLIPLLAGGDLSGRRAGRAAEHAGRSAACRSLLEETRAALDAARAEAGRTAPAWGPGEFERLVSAAVSRSREARRDGRRRPLAWRLAPAAALVMLAVVLKFAVFDGALRRVRPPLPGAGPEPSPGQARQVISMVLVSPETGLQVTWFLDSEFEFKGE